MCTTLASAATPGVLLFAGNRDELRTRSRALPPSLDALDGMPIIWPRDPDGGGTWTAANAAGLAFSLLNYYQGRTPPAATRSRGLVIPALASAPTLDVVRARLLDLDVEHMGPFTLRVAACGLPDGLQATWDGDRFDLTSWALPGLAVSSGFSLDLAEPARATSLHPILHHTTLDLDAVKRAFSDHHPTQGPASVCMHSPLSHTVSHTQIAIDAHRVIVRYFDGQPCQTHDFTELHMPRLTTSPPPP